MNGSILGFSAEELRDLYDRAVAFSGLGEFMDMPIKMYSSGMIARLAFTVAIHSEPDVLIVDEALAVGDAIFSHRCLGRIQHMLQRGTALVLVTHDVNAVRQMCDQAMLIDSGKAIAQGEPESVLMRYQTLVAERLSAAGEQFQQTGLENTVRGEDLRYGTFDAVIEGITVCRPDGERTRRFQSRDTMRVSMAVHFRRDVEDPVFGIMLRNRFGLEVFGTNTHLRREHFGPVAAGSERTVTIELDLSLVPGTYAVSLAVHTPEGHFHDYQVEAATIEVLPPIAVIGVANLPIELDVREGIDRDAIETLTPAPAKESGQ
jgi:lipopolysaccharide transport system ATP-binding protein